MPPYFNRHQMQSMIVCAGFVPSNSFTKSADLPRGLAQNMGRSLYHGCCMAFKKVILDMFLAFSRKKKQFFTIVDRYLG
jgi:hypothetical protein